MTYQSSFSLLITSLALLPTAFPEETYVCDTEGRFADPYDCTSYIECIQSTGVLYPRRDQCGKGGFDPRLRQCVPFKELKGCHAREARLVKNEIRNPDLDHLCITGKGFLCADCSTQVHCIDGHAFVKKCKSNDVCTEREEFAGGVCHPDYVEECFCKKSNDFVADPYDLSGFFFCNEYAEPQRYKCSKNTVWDDNIKQCVRPTGTFPSCDKTGTGVFAHKDNCRVYYKCIHIEGGWLQSDFECGYRQMFSEINDRCENPCTWFRGSFTCENEGRFADDTDCSAYFECVDEGRRFRQIKYHCPIDCVWQQDEDGSSGDCVKKEMAQCTELVPTQCDVPPDWCTSNFAPPGFGDSLFVGQGASSGSSSQVPEGNTEGDEDIEPSTNPEGTGANPETAPTEGGDDEAVIDELSGENGGFMLGTEVEEEVSNSEVSELEEEVNPGGEGSDSESTGGEGTVENVEDGEEMLSITGENSDVEEMSDINTDVDESEINNGLSDGGNEETGVTNPELNENVDGNTGTEDGNQDGEISVDNTDDIIFIDSEGNVGNSISTPPTEGGDIEVTEGEENIGPDGGGNEGEGSIGTEGGNEGEESINSEGGNEGEENIDSEGGGNEDEESIDTEGVNEGEMEGTAENDYNDLDFPTSGLVDVEITVGEENLPEEESTAEGNAEPEVVLDEFGRLAEIHNDLSLLNNYYRVKRKSRLLQFL